MKTPNELSETVEQFALVAAQFCGVVDAVLSLDRSEFCTQIYRLLPKLIDQAISLPDVAPSNAEGGQDEEGIKAPPTSESLSVEQSHAKWKLRYSLLTEKLEDWDLYREVFNPVSDAEVVYGSLADDLADIYRDLSEPLNETSTPPEDRIWAWRFSFRSHWGQHAVDALRAIHSRRHFH
ncbi:MAG TPA: DUF5063 domain-containing protein [Terracidiphilus sp.]|nr:DUF5063 domain-containing protein [Terracidiphilus sp.]